MSDCPLCSVALDLHDGPGSCHEAAQKEFINVLPFVLRGRHPRTARCPACLLDVEVHLEGWFYDHSITGRLNSEICVGSGKQSQPPLSMEISDRWYPR